MKTKLKLSRMLSIMFFCLGSVIFAQNNEIKRSIGDVVYQEYEQNGIDKALQKYKNLKANSLTQYHWSEEELNTLGYQLMSKKDLEAAEKVFRLNMKEYPKAANPNDSYADYLIEEGDFDKAKKYLRKSIKIAKDSEIENENTRIFNISTAKLAKLEKENQQLDFLLGNWDVEVTGFEKGQKTFHQTGKAISNYDAENSMLTTLLTNSAGVPFRKNILVYNALEKNYDLGYVEPTAPMGISMSKLVVKDLGSNKYELIENGMNRKGEKMTTKHEIEKKSDDILIWTMYSQEKDNKNWEKSSVWNYKKSM